MSFEQALKELETIVDRLEKGDVELEASILIYERGEALKTHCDGLLRKAEARVEKISLNQNGQPTGTEPLDVEKVSSIVTLSLSPSFGRSVMRASGTGSSPSGSSNRARCQQRGEDRLTFDHGEGCRRCRSLAQRRTAYRRSGGGRPWLRR